MNAAVTAHAEFSTTYPTSATPVDESYACTIAVPIASVSQAATLSVTVQGAPPSNVPPGAKFDMALFQMVATIPASAIATAVSDGCTSVSGSITTLDIDATGNPVVNAAAASPSSYDFGPITLVSGQGVTLSLPATPATLTSWTAPASGTVSFTTSTAASSLFANLSFTCDSIPGITGTLTCAATAPTAFATTTVP
jgi:hypothetical protein